MLQAHFFKSEMRKKIGEEDKSDNGAVIKAVTTVLTEGDLSNVY